MDEKREGEHMPNDKGHVEEIAQLSDVEVPSKFYNRILLGVQVLDEIFGGTDFPGILGGTSILFTGMPGAGKSTMCLQLADLLEINAGMSVLYNIGEESPYMVKLRADRIGLKQKFCVSQITDVDHLIAVARELGVEVLVQDSLQTLDIVGERGDSEMLHVAQKLHSFSKSDGVTVIVVGHITKGGRFRGPMAIEHEVDAHAHLRYNKDTGNRIFEMQKNRFGPAMMPYEFALSANGLDFQRVLEGEEEKKISKSADRRAVIVELIKTKLMEGEAISGYCFERLGADCSGGFWRVLLAKAVHQLTQQGMRIEERRINGRLHNMVVVPEEAPAPMGHDPN